MAGFFRTINGVTMNCLLSCFSKLTVQSVDKITEYLGHDGSLPRGCNIYELMEYTIKNTKYRPVVLQRTVYDITGSVLNEDLTSEHWDDNVPKIILSLNPDHATAMYRDGSTYCPALRRSLTEEELETLKKKHYALILLYCN